MTKIEYKKAEEIYGKLKEFRKLRSICSYPYKKYALTKKFLWLSPYARDEVVLCDDELTKLIYEYCNKKISELEKELDALRCDICKK